MSVVRVHTSPVSEAHSCTPSFLNLSTSPPSQSHPIQPRPPTCLRRRPLHCGSVPRICDRHTGSLSFARFFPRESADHHNMEFKFWPLTEAYPPPDQPTTDDPIAVFFFSHTQFFIVNYLYHRLIPPHHSYPPRSPRSTLRVIDQHPQ
jgi:hypothetical protein